MARQVDIKTIARCIIVGEDVDPKLTKSDFSRLLQLLARWTRGAHVRALRAEERLHEMPNWERQIKHLEDEQRRQRFREGNLTRDRDALEEQLRKAAEQTDEILTQLTRELNESREETIRQQGIAAALRQHCEAGVLALQAVELMHESQLRLLQLNAATLTPEGLQMRDA